MRWGGKVPKSTPEVTKVTEEVAKAAKRAEGVDGAARLSNIKVSQEGIQDIRKHLATMDFDQANQFMIKRLEDIASGTLKPTKVDLNFYAHELREMELIKQGMKYPEAHARALREYGIEYKEGYEFQLYTKEAIKIGDKCEKARIDSLSRSLK